METTHGSASSVSPPGTHVLAVERLMQPDDVSCGPTSMMMVCHHHGDPITFEEASAAIERNEDGGTLAVHIGSAALARGYRARIWSWNMRLFDPTWKSLSHGELLEKTRARRRVVSRPRARYALGAYGTFLEGGGQVGFAELEPQLLVDILDKGRPILVGLSATYLYQMAREHPADNRTDDVGGDPVGHFLVISGYEDHGRRFVVKDPFRTSPLDATGSYVVEAQRLLNAILLGQVTYDAVLLEMWPATGGTHA
jgi:hypothetical protein